MKFKSIMKECALYAHSFSVPFKCGVSKDTRHTNETNLQSVRETNDANKQIAKETNEANIAMNKANNDLQIQLQNEMNEYNSVQSQLERAREAGINPNAVIQGNIAGNLQNSLPSTTAGHADQPTPMIPFHADNPYMERLATIEQLRGITKDFFENRNIDAQTENTRAQTVGQNISNSWEDDLKDLQKRLGSAQVDKMRKEIDVMGDQQQLMRDQSKQVQASIANMNEDTRTKFLNNYFSLESRNSFIKYCREDLDSRGIPRNKQLSDDALLAVRYGALSMWNVPMSQQQVNDTQSMLNRAGVGVQKALRNLYNANTKQQYIQNAYDEMFGWADRAGAIQETDERINNLKKGSNKIQQDIDINKWQESEEVQVQRAYSVTVNNLQTEANIDNTKVNTVKQGVETVKTGTDIITSLKPW